MESIKRIAEFIREYPFPFNIFIYVIIPACIYNLYKKIKDKVENTYLRLNAKQSSLTIQEKNIERLMDSISRRGMFDGVASLMADIESLRYCKAEVYLKSKSHPAMKAAEIVAQLREEHKQQTLAYKRIKYSYEYLLMSLPQLASIRDNMEEEMGPMMEYLNDEANDIGRDKIHDYLSDEEYKRLSEIERNQLALDRYISSHKTRWQIGRDYEMACAYRIKKKGHSVVMNGIERGYNDLGRDIIAEGISKKGNHIIWIIQCKCWRNMPIRENTVMQLYGTTTSYKYENYERIKKEKISVIPIMMYPPFTEMTETAKKYMEILGCVAQIQEEMEFPRIKCNINGKDKIYHLPFDQQYDRTQIKNNGEFMAWSVAEAESKGFRRAKRHNIKE